MTIDTLVSALPEVYQPIYGHPEYDGLASRPSDDRLELLSTIHDQLTAAMGRPLHVLDLGCAQGYLSLSLADRGAVVIGVDRLASNIALCRALASERPGRAVRFEEKSLEDMLEHLQPGTIDLVIGMSVIHHLCAEKGATWTRALMKAVAAKVEAAVFEVALKEEPLPWAPYQAETPNWLYQDFAFVAEVGAFPTHLSEHLRPVYFASNNFWLTNHSLVRFSHWTARTHELESPESERGRRYFDDGERLLKLFQFSGPLAAANRRELESEVAFLARSDIAGLGFPRLYDHHFGKHEGWVLRERVQGSLLSTCLLRGDVLRPFEILHDVIRQLAALEELGLYHDDLRSWNILIRPDGTALLLDYGSITSRNQDREYLQDWRIPLLILLSQLFGSADRMVWPPQLSDLHVSRMPAAIAGWVQRLWRDPPDAWTWHRFASEWVAASTDGPQRLSLSLADTLELMTDEALLARLERVETEISQITQRLQAWDRLLAPFRPLIRLLKIVLGK